MTARRRIQRKRTASFRLPANTICVTRPGKWGNPFPAYDSSIKERQTATLLLLNLLGSRATHLDQEHLMPYPSDEEIRAELAGKNLACWCPLPKDGEQDWCHAAVLLGWAAERVIVQ